MINFQGSNYFRIVLAPFWKGIYSKRKEFASFGSKFFPFRVDSISEGTRQAGKPTGSHNNCLPWKKKWQEIYQVYPDPLSVVCGSLGPVVQSIVSLTSSLRVISLTVLADSIYNILIFFAEKMWVAFALQKLLTFF